MQTIFGGLLHLIETLHMEGRTRLLEIYAPDERFVSGLLDLSYWDRFEIKATDVDYEKSHICSSLVDFIAFLIFERAPISLLRIRRKEFPAPKINSRSLLLTRCYRTHTTATPQRLANFKKPYIL